jgi:hypothetical protein
MQAAPPPEGVIAMPDTTSTTAPNAQATFTARPPATDLNTGTALRRAVLAARKGLPR